MSPLPLSLSCHLLLCAFATLSSASTAGQEPFSMPIAAHATLRFFAIRSHSC